MLTSFFIITVVAAGVVAIMFGRQWRHLSAGRITVSSEGDFSAVIQSRLDRFYFGFADFFTQLGHQLYYWTLLGLRHLAIWFKILLHKTEKKFSRLIDSVRGKGVLNKKGSVSLFLAQLKQNK